MLVATGLALASRDAKSSQPDPTAPPLSHRCRELLSAYSHQVWPHEDRARALVEAYNRGEQNPAFSETIRAELDPEFSTVRIISPNGRVPKGSQGRVVLLHGMGAETSRHSAWLQTVATLGDRRNQLRGTAAQIQGMPGFRPLAPEALDLPRHGFGPRNGFESADDVAHWLGKYLNALKAATPELPLIVVARSASPLFVTALNRLKPGLIDAMVLMSPSPVPGDPKVLKRSEEQARADLSRQGKVITPELGWVYKVAATQS